MARKTSHLQSKRLADPSTFGLLDGAMAEAKARYEQRLSALSAEMAPLVKAQRTGALSSADEAKLMTLRVQFAALSTEQKAPR